MANRLVRDTSGDITRIVLLGTLAQGPAHGYEIKAKLARWHMEWWADLQSGAIYAGLQRLERDGLIERTRSEQEGKRPVRHVYGITAAGSDELRRLLTEAWRGVTRYSRPIDVALSFFYELKPDEIEPLLRERLIDLTQLRVLFEDGQLPDSLGSLQKQMVPDLWAHERFLLDAEIEFTRLLIRRFEEGAYGAR